MNEEDIVRRLQKLGEAPVSQGCKAAVHERLVRDLKQPSAPSLKHTFQAPLLLMAAAAVLVLAFSWTAHHMSKPLEKDAAFAVQSTPFAIQLTLANPAQIFPAGEMGFLPAAYLDDSLQPLPDFPAEESEHGVPSWTEMETLKVPELDYRDFTPNLHLAHVLPSLQPEE